jgi:hypothetical protein
MLLNALRYEDIRYHSQRMSLLQMQRHFMHPHYGNGRFLHWYPDEYIHANRFLDLWNRWSVNAGNFVREEA